MLTLHIKRQLSKIENHSLFRYALLDGVLSY